MRQGKETTTEQIVQMREELRRSKLKTLGLFKSAGSASRRKLIKRIISWVLFFGISGFLLFTLVAVYVAKSQGEIPSIFGGYSLFIVESGSMEPTLTVGSVILTKKPDDAARLKVKNIVTFRTMSGQVVTHRIIETVTDEQGGVSYRTKGDNPINSPDQELLSPDRVIGVFVLKVPFT